jgi:hypothetical protein
MSYQKSTPDYFHTLLNQTKKNTFKILLLRDYRNFTNTRRVNQILTLNYDGQLLDTMNLIKGFGPISFPQKVQNNYIWSFSYADTSANPPVAAEAYLFNLDSNYNYVSKKRLTNNITEDEYPSNVIEIKNKLYVAVKNNTHNFTKIYKLNLSFTKLDSVVFNGATVIEMQNSNNQILISGAGFPISNISGSGQKVIMDTTLNLINIFNLDSLTFVNPGCLMNIGASPLYSLKVMPISNSKTIIFGNADATYNSNCSTKVVIVNSLLSYNNSILNTNLIIDANKNVSYLDNTNFIDYKNNTFYTVGVVGYNYQSPQLLQPQPTSIKVTKLDTLNNIIWSQNFGNDMFYRPISIITTLDSGCLVSGIRYDATNTLFPNIGQGFVLKLDKFGDQTYVGIKENNNSSFVSLTCFPNPTTDIIYFDLPFTLSYKLDIRDIFGKTIYSNLEYKNLTPVSTLNFTCGAYVYQITIKDKTYFGKFIKN